MTSPARSYSHRVAGAHVLAGHVLAVVQRRPRDRHAAELDRLQDGHGRQQPRAADLHDDVRHRRLLGARGELVGEGPAGMPRRGPQAVPGGQVVQLDDDAVDLEAERFAPGGHPIVVGEDLVDRPARVVLAARAQPPRPQRVQQFGAAREAGTARHVQHIVEEHFEPAIGRHAGIELSDGAGGRVARVGEGRLTPLREPPVQRLEVPDADERLAAHREPARHARSIVAQPQGNGPDRLHVLGDALAPLSVAARRRPDEQALLVHELERQPVELRLQLPDGIAPEGIAHPGVEPPDVLGIDDGIEAQQRREVPHGRESGERRAGHPLRRRVGGHQPRMRPFQPLQLAEQPVVGRIGDLRPIQDVVTGSRGAGSPGAASRCG